MKRRRFIQNSLWLTTGLLVGCGKEVIETQLKVVRGKVLALGQPLEGVVVSDGFATVTTAKDGSFELHLDAAAKHVFVSVPAGFQIPHVNHLARHYRSLKELAVKFPYSTNATTQFDLVPLEVADDIHQFVVWADPQIGKSKEVSALLSQSVPDVKNYKTSLSANTLLHGITVGDIVDDTLQLFQAYNSAVDDFGFPFFQAIGNHDLVLNEGPGESCRVRFKETYGPTYYSFNRGMVHYIVLDNVEYAGMGYEYKGSYASEQLSWLRKDLSYVTTDKLIVLAQHIPLSFCTDGKAELLEILKPYEVHVMSGHMHYNRNVVSDKLYEHIHGSVSGAWWSGSVCIDGAPLGYAVYEVEGTKLKWYYKSIGHDRQHQLRAYVVNKDNKKLIQANVWNYDPAWKVEWYADGAYMGNLNAIFDYDPMAFNLYNGNMLPAGQAWVDPVKTDHLFSADLPPGVKRIRVVATDRFGQQYEYVKNV